MASISGGGSNIQHTGLQSPTQTQTGQTEQTAQPNPSGASIGATALREASSENRLINIKTLSPGEAKSLLPKSKEGRAEFAAKINDSYKSLVKELFQNPTSFAERIEDHVYEKTTDENGNLAFKTDENGEKIVSSEILDPLVKSAKERINSNLSSNNPSKHTKSQELKELIKGGYRDANLHLGNHVKNEIADLISIINDRDPVETKHIVDDSHASKLATKHTKTLKNHFEHSNQFKGENISKFHIMLNENSPDLKVTINDSTPNSAGEDGNAQTLSEAIAFKFMLNNLIDIGDSVSGANGEHGHRDNIFNTGNTAESYVFAEKPKSSDDNFSFHATARHHFIKP